MYEVALRDIHIPDLQWLKKKWSVWWWNVIRFGRPVIFVLGTERMKSHHSSKGRKPISYLFRTFTHSYRTCWLYVYMLSGWFLLLLFHSVKHYSRGGWMLTGRHHFCHPMTHPYGIGFHATMCTTLLGTFQVLQVIKAPIHSTWGSSFIHGSRYHPNDFHRVLSTCYTLFKKIKGKKVNIGTTSVVNMNPMVPFTIH